jgi:NAD(P)-dependent dehydrogenase (short-subunit alcohol dehydrogenase family)
MSQGRIALVTGGNRGLGRSTIEALAKRGVHVIFTYRSHPEEADQVVQAVQSAGVKAAAVQFDAEDPSSIPQLAEAFKGKLSELGADKFDYLVNMAGYSDLFKIEGADPASIDRMYTVSFKSVWLVTSALLPLLKDGDGRIINISSGLTRFTVGDRAAYASMKTAIETYTKYLAMELGPRGIRAIVVAPGVIATDFGGGGVRDNKGGAKDHLSNMIALKRVGEPEDIGPAIAALLGSEFGWANGTRIELSGGQSL